MDHIPAPNQVDPLPDQRRDGLPVGQAEVDRRVRGRRPARRLGQQQAGPGQDAERHAHPGGTGKQTGHRVPNSVKARYGRWEARVRIRETNHDGRRYRGYWELIPTGDFKCGAKSIVLASYRSEDRKVTGAVRVPEKTQYSFSKRVALHNGWFHTYAVEITKDHISWFVDTKVIHTERREDALRGIEYRPRFRLQGVKGEKHRTTWLQMDWVRHYDLSRPNAKSIKAPRMRKGVYKDPC